MVEQENALNLLMLLEPEYVANPYAFYHRLRGEDPVLWDPVVSGWVLTRHADVMAVLRDGRFSAVRSGNGAEWLPEQARDRLAPAARAFTRRMLFLDPPDHTRIRKLVSKAFTPRVVEQMRARIQTLVEALLAEPRRSGHMELIESFAFPLPVTVIAEMLGVPPEDREQFAVWTQSFGALLDGVPLPEEAIVQAFEDLSAMLDYMRSAAARHRLHPAEDLLQALIDAEDQGDMLTEDEALINSILLLAAGHGTTTHLLGNGLLALLRYPDQLQRLRRQPALIPGAVVELLRYDGPVQATARVAREDLEIGGKQIGAGQLVIALLGAANHDPAQFPNPDRLDVMRQGGQHVAFGYGTHFCLGAPLARLEAEIAFNALVRLENLRLEIDEPTWDPSLVFRGLQALPVTFSPAL
jgi:cytochrome P450